MKRSLLVFSIALLSAPSAEATILIKMDLPQLVGRSDVIFVGKAIESRSHWSEDGRHIVTDTTFKVSQAVHGSPGSTVVIRRLGGKVGDIGMRVSGMPELRTGDEVLLFTERRSNGKRYVVGMKQGVFRVHRDAAGRQMVAPGRLDGLTLARRTPQGRLETVEPPATPAPQPLGDLVKRIRLTVTYCAKEKSRCHAD